MMITLNDKIKILENEIKELKTKIADLTKNNQEKTPNPHSLIGNSKKSGWYFIRGKWCTYAIYSD